MPSGADAAAAGMDTVAATADIRLAYDEINKSRDYIAQRTSAVTPVAKGGTGATDAAAARANLDVPRAGTVGGRAVMDISGDGNVGLRYNGSRFVGRSGGTELELANLLDSNGALSAANNANNNANGRVAKSGDTMTGHLFLPNSVPATSGWTACVINGDGRVSRGASSERFKKYISEVQPLVLGDLFPPLKRWQMKGGDGRWSYGHTAEQLAANPATEPFVVYESVVDDDGVARVALDDAGKPIPYSVDFISLLMAKVAQLDARVKQLEAGEA